MVQVGKKLQIIRQVAVYLGENFSLALVSAWLQSGVLPRVCRDFRPKLFQQNCVAGGLQWHLSQADTDKLNSSLERVYLGQPISSQKYADRFDSPVQAEPQHTHATDR